MNIFAIVLGAVYFIVGTVKIVGVKHMADQFEEFKLGRAGMLAAGGLEVAAAVGLQISPLRTLAATGMVFMMLGAVYFHLKVKHSKDMAVPAVVVLLASLAFVALNI